MMTPLITDEDFIGTINIDTSQAATVESLNLAIMEYQEKYLELLFGESMFADYLQNESSDKYKTLVDGPTNGVYSLLDKNYRFTGLKKMIADFVYFHFVGQQTNSNTPNGNVQPNVANGQIVNDTTTLVYVYNEAVHLWKSAVAYIEAQNYIGNTYPDFDPFRKMNTINCFGI